MLVGRIEDLHVLFFLRIRIQVPKCGPIVLQSPVVKSHWVRSPRRVKKTAGGVKGNFRTRNSNLFFITSSCIQLWFKELVFHKQVVKLEWRRYKVCFFRGWSKSEWWKSIQQWHDTWMGLAKAELEDSNQWNDHELVFNLYISFFFKLWKFPKDSRLIIINLTLFINDQRRIPRKLWGPNWTFEGDD